MKTHRIAAILLCIGIMLQTSSCLVLVKKEHSSSKPGWDKNTNNPHNPNTTNPGKAKGHRK